MVAAITLTFHTEPLFAEGHTGAVPLVAFASLRVLITGVLLLSAIGGLGLARLRKPKRTSPLKPEEESVAKLGALDPAVLWQIQDALLQDFQGVVLTFHVAAQSVPRDNAAKSMLENALATADDIIAEARVRIEHLDARRSGFSEKPLQNGKRSKSYED